jgi:periplasmic protein TonB
MEPKTRHWLVALVSAVAVHLSLLTLFERSAEPVAPVQGILIELGDGGDVGVDASGPESLSPPGDEDLPKAEPMALQPLESIAVSEARAEEMDTVDLKQPEDPVDIAETVPVPDAGPIIAKSLAPAKADTTIRPRPKPKKQRKARPTKTKKKVRKTRREKKIAKGPARATAVSGSKGKSGKGTGKQGAGTGSGASAAASQNRYAGLISAWLNRNKRYPMRARRLGRQGSVTVRFTVNRDGHVLSSTIVRSSGHTALDDEVRALMRRGRMPRIPKTMKQARMTMTVPIRFQLQ